MGDIFALLGWVFLGAGIALGGVAWHRQRQAKTADNVALISAYIQWHFAPAPLQNITISERTFPFRVRADLQKAVDQLFASGTIVHFSGVRTQFSVAGVSLSDCIYTSGHDPAVSVPPQYEELDVGDAAPVRCLKNGFWLRQEGADKYVVLLTPTGHISESHGMQVQIAVQNTPEGARIIQTFFTHLENSVRTASTYRGKILSLEKMEHSYGGAASGITVHKLRTVTRDDVILPAKTVNLLDRNVIQFVGQRPQLARFKQATKKGILFYGPPGTGKTHTIHYLARALEGHTTLLISAEQVALLAEYMILARLLQPSLVIVEDVDLIARERTEMNSPCEEVLLNKLLNEMDGLKEDAEILFVLTTNRPESLEKALASRPGRIDQAIEFPLPDDKGREKLSRLYSQGVEVSDEAARAIVDRTEGVSAAFIKELMRRSVQFHLERNGSGRIELPDVESALEELLISGGSLNLKLLGAEATIGGADQCA